MKDKFTRSHLTQQKRGSNVETLEHKKVKNGLAQVKNRLAYKLLQN